MLAQDSLIAIQFGFKERDQLLDALLVRRLPIKLLEHPFLGDAARDRVELRILDAGRLLELGTGLGLGGEQLWARPKRGEIAPDSARLEQLKVVLLTRRQKNTAHQILHTPP